MPERVREILKLLSQTVSAMKIFPTSHSTILRLLDDLTSRFKSVLDEHGAIEIGVQEQSFIFEGEPVFTEEQAQRGLPFFFHKDGMQMLFFYPGLDRPELAEFLEIIRRESFLPPDEADIVNALWEREFGNIQYFAPDDFLESRVLREREEWAEQMHVVETDGIVLSTVEVKTDPGKLRGGRIELNEDDKAAATAIAATEEIREVEAESSGSARSKEDQASALRKAALNDEEADRIELMMRSNRDQLPHQEYIDLLIEILFLEDTPALFHSTASVLEQHFMDMVQQEEYGQARMLIDGIRLLKGHFEEKKDSDKVSRLDDFLRFTRDAKIIEILRAQIMDKEVADPEGLMDFLGIFGSAVLHILAEVYERIEDHSFREKVFSHFKWAAGEDFRSVVNLVNEHRPVLTRMLIGILAELKNKKTIPFFANFLNYTDKDLKFQAIDSLGEFEDETANRILLEFMKDYDPEIRTRAALKLRYLGDLGRVKQMIHQAKSSEFRKKNSIEQLAIFTFLGKSRTDEACDYLRSVLMMPSLLSAKVTHLRLMAAEALALMGTDGARAVLERGSRVFSKKVNRACLAALGGPAPASKPKEKPEPPPSGENLP